MTPHGIALFCLAIIGYGILQRLTQLILWILNGHRS